MLLKDNSGHTKTSGDYKPRVEIFNLIFRDWYVLLFILVAGKCVMAKTDYYQITQQYSDGYCQRNMSFSEYLCVL